MTILGLFALLYYTVLLASGVVGTDVMPQFVITAVIFLSSGRILGEAARRNRAPNERQEGKKPAEEPDWAHLTDVLRWVMAFLIMGALGLWVLKPVGVSFFEMFLFKWAG